MSKRKDFDMMNYDKYRQSHNNARKNTRTFTRILTLGAAANRQKEARKRRRRREWERKQKEYDRKIKSKHQNDDTPITLKGVIAFAVFFALFYLFIDTTFTIGLMAAIDFFLILFFIIIVIFVIIFLIYITKKGFSNNNLSKKEIEELHRCLDNIEVYKDVVNNSLDAYSVKCAMDELLYIIDFIMKYDEKSLNSIGMTKQHLPSQKKFITENYDIILNQLDT